MARVHRFLRLYRGRGSSTVNKYLLADGPCLVRNEACRIMAPRPARLRSSPHWTKLHDECGYVKFLFRAAAGDGRICATAVRSFIATKVYTVTRIWRNRSRREDPQLVSGIFLLQSRLAAGSHYTRPQLYFGDHRLGPTQGKHRSDGCLIFLYTRSAASRP